LQQIKFLYGNNLSKETPFTAGTVYLDLATGELYFDAPNAETGDHAKVIDSATLIYTITESISFPSSGGEDSGSTSAKLGVAVLGSMKLGME
jgi:hypothetical protein